MWFKKSKPEVPKEKKQKYSGDDVKKAVMKTRLMRHDSEKVVNYLESVLNELGRKPV